MDARHTPREASSFLEAQALSSRRLGFSVTRACPLRCAHCSVSAAPELYQTTFSKEFGEHIASQMPALKAQDIRFIDFTGGEPILAGDFVRTVSAAARDCGMSCGIVTSAHWATNEFSARKLIDSFKDIENWDISTDIYHLDFVPLERVKLAFKLLTESGHPPLIRIAYHEPMTQSDAVLIDEVYKFAGQRIAFQPVGPVGRAAEIFQYAPVSGDTWDHTPCPTTGPLVQSDGLVAPCCAPLSHEDYNHPLRLGNAFNEPLTTIVDRWRIHPLLQTIRLWGFEPIIRWFTESDTDYSHLLRHRTCHQCVEMIRDPKATQIAMAHANQFSHRIKLAYAILTQYDERWLDNQLRKEAQAFLMGELEVQI
jgi:MoaA/NifB/PqqE/SkfB family radical SAM enzyme